MAVAARPRSPLITRQGVRVPGASPSATYSASAASSAVAASSNASSKASSSSTTAAAAPAPAGAVGRYTLAISLNGNLDWDESGWDGAAPVVYDYYNALPTGTAPTGGHKRGGTIVTVGGIGFVSIDPAAGLFRVRFGDGERAARAVRGRGGGGGDRHRAGGFRSQG